MLAVAGWRGGVILYRVADGVRLHKFHARAERLSDVAFSPDDTLLANDGHVGMVGGTVQVWRVRDGQEVRILQPRAYVDSITWTPNGQQLAVASHRGVEFWDVQPK